VDEGKLVFNYSKGDYDKLRDIVRSHDWSSAAALDV
jgi:hypothetical protein